MTRQSDGYTSEIVSGGMRVLRCDVKRCDEPASYWAVLRFGPYTEHMHLCSAHHSLAVERELEALKRRVRSCEERGEPYRP